MTKYNEKDKFRKTSPEGPDKIWTIKKVRFDPQGYPHYFMVREDNEDCWDVIVDEELDRAIEDGILTRDVVK